MEGGNPPAAPLLPEALALGGISAVIFSSWWAGQDPSHAVGLPLPKGSSSQNRDEAPPPGSPPWGRQRGLPQGHIPVKPTLAPPVLKFLSVAPLPGPSAARAISNVTVLKGSGSSQAWGDVWGPGSWPQPAVQGGTLNPHPPRLNREDGPSLQACCGLRLCRGPKEDGSHNHHFSSSHESACRTRATPAGLPWARPAHSRASRVATTGALHPGTTASIPTSQGRGAPGRVPDHTICLLV